MIYLDNGATTRMEEGAATPSHVLTAIGRTKQEALSAARFTLSWRNSREELDTVIETIKGLI